MLKSLVRNITGKDEYKLYPMNSRYTYRYDIVNHLIQKFGFERYLEIGCRLDGSFKLIDVKIKMGVDPNSGGTHRMTSDEFFAQNTDKFDVIFVDGLHWGEQVYKDIVNGLACLNPGGYIVAHDTVPKKDSHQVYPMEESINRADNPQQIWLGDCWKAIVEARKHEDIDLVTLDTNFGCTVIRKGSNTDRLSLDGLKMEYSEFKNDANALLKVVSEDEFDQWLNKAN